MWEVYSHSIFVGRCGAGMQSTRVTLNAFLLILWSFSRQANVFHELSFSRSWKTSETKVTKRECSVWSPILSTVSAASKMNLPETGRLYLSCASCFACRSK
jgi:hypothetical protein